MSAEEEVKGNSGVCPLCSKVIPLNELNKHVNDCLDHGDVNTAIIVNSSSNILHKLASQSTIDVDSDINNNNNNNNNSNNNNSNNNSQNTLSPPRNQHIQTPIPIRPISTNNPYVRIISRSNSPKNPNPNPLIHTSDDHLLCTICNTPHLLTQIVFLDCSHHFCRTCLHSYVIEMIESNRVSSINCKECRSDFSPMDIKEILSGQEYEKYMEASLQEVVDVTEIFLRCPNPKCRNLMERIREASPHLPKYYPPLTVGGTPIYNMPYTNRKTPSPSPSPSPPIEQINIRSKQRSKNPRELGPNGQFLSTEAMKHRDENRFRCRECGTTFCATCGIAPYHVGFTCETFKRYETSQNCRYCNTSLAPAPKPQTLSRYSFYNPFLFPRFPASLASIPTSMRTLIPTPISVLAQLSFSNPLIGIPSSILPHHLPNPVSIPPNTSTTTTTTTTELSHTLAKKVCNNLDCQNKFFISCTKTLACGHLCCGIKNETKCLPCLEPLCANLLNDLEEPPLSSSSSSSKVNTHDLPQRQLGVDFCAICWVEVLESSPCIQLECGHIFHYECVRKKVNNGWSGKSITFSFLDCALCQRRMSHPALEKDMKPMLELYNSVSSRAIDRLKKMKEERCPEITTPSSRWYNNLEGYAMYRFSYFLCSKCDQPYFGGERVCEEEATHEFNKAELVCGKCASGVAVCQIHGSEYIEYKCRFCCQTAVFFCWGNTHFCDKCHDNCCTVRNTPIDKLPPCTCRRPHPPNGEEFCYGCSVCIMIGAD